jgi:hypothetical protein
MMHMYQVVMRLLGPSRTTYNFPGHPSTSPVNLKVPREDLPGRTPSGVVLWLLSTGTIEQKGFKELEFGEG